MKAEPMWGLLLLSLHFKHNIWVHVFFSVGFPGGLEVKASACNAGHPGSIPGSGRSPGEGNGNPPHCSCLENPMDRGAWWATVHGVAKSWTRLSNFTFFPSLLWKWHFSLTKLDRSIGASGLTEDVAVFIFPKLFHEFCLPMG